MKKKPLNPTQIHIEDTTDLILDIVNQRELDVEYPTNIVEENVAENVKLPEPMIASLDENAEYVAEEDENDFAFKLR